jgi:hypothetical protein
VNIAGAVSFVVLSIAPIPGIIASIPLAVLKLAYPPWIVPLIAMPLSFVQVLVVNYLWDQLQTLTAVKNVIEKKRSARVDALIASGGSFWPVYIATPLLGPSLIMMFMRYARISLRHVWLPMALSLMTLAVVVTALCVYVPAWFSEA